jgi:Tol biopolymer transport system component
VSRITTALVAVALFVICLVAGPSTATFSGKNGRISFSRAVDRKVDIFTADRDGSHIRRLTFSTPAHAAAVESDWSPDGQLIAFDSDRTDIDGRKKTVQIFLTPADGGDATQLTRGPGFHGEAGWSPTGSTIAIDSDWGDRSLNGIWLIPASDPDGVTVDEAVRVTDARGGGGKFDIEPQFSPDGSTIFFTRFKSPRQTAIYRVNADGTGEKRLTTYGLNASHSDVSPDGRWITFDSGDSGEPGVTGNIYLLRADGSGKKRALTDRPPLMPNGPFDLAQNPVFSPNGRKILYTQFRPPGSDLIVMKTDGSGKHTILGGKRFPNKADWGTNP